MVEINTCPAQLEPSVRPFASKHSKHEGGEHGIVPFPMNLAPAGITSYCRHTLEIYFGKDRVNILQLWVQHPDEKELPSLMAGSPWTAPLDMAPVWWTTLM